MDGTSTSDETFSCLYFVYKLEQSAHTSHTHYEAAGPKVSEREKRRRRKEDVQLKRSHAGSYFMKLGYGLMGIG